MAELPSSLSTQERLDRIRLIRSQNVGPVSFRQLLHRFGSASAALEVLPSLAQRGGLRRELRICDTATATREWEAIERLGGRHVILGDLDYPTALAAISDAPAALSVLGNAELLSGTGLSGNNRLTLACETTSKLWI